MLLLSPTKIEELKTLISSVDILVWSKANSCKYSQSSKSWELEISRNWFCCPNTSFRQGIAPNCTGESRLFCSSCKWSTRGRPKPFRKLNFKKNYNNIWKKRKINEICCVLHYISHIGMCCPKGRGFGAVLARNKYFVHFGFKSGMVFEGSNREGYSSF